MLTNLTVPLLGLVDTAVLGHLHSLEYLGAVAVGANLFSILYWTFGFMRMGTTGLAAQAWVAEQREAAEKERQLTQKDWTLEELMERGEKAYATACAACHQADGSGAPPGVPRAQG